MFFPNLRFVIILFLFFFGNFSLASPETIADKIQKKFDENLFKMRPLNQSHYAVRLYRITGNTDYLYPIIAFQFIESEQLEHLLKKRTCCIEKFSLKGIRFPLNYIDLSKTKKRKILLEHFPGINNALNILLILDHAQQLNALNSPLYTKEKIAIDHIKQNIRYLSTFLLDYTVIKVSSAQVANFIYLLNRLNLIDLRQEYIKRFKLVFAEQNDHRLSDKIFEDKIYGMTHIIFAASDYYQKPLSYQKFKWIYDYFEKNIDRILTKTKPDVIAEVGLTFCLLKHNNHSKTLDKIKLYLQNKFDKNTQMLMGQYGDDDLNRAEHRNVLTIMLFKWPSSIHTGPNLENTDHLLNTLRAVQPL